MPELIEQVRALALLADPSDIASQAVSLYFESEAKKAVIDEAQKEIKQLLQDLMGEMGTLSFATENGSVKLSKGSVVRRLDTAAIKAAREADPEFDKLMAGFEKAAEQAGSLRFTKKPKGA